MKAAGSDLCCPKFLWLARREQAGGRPDGPREAAWRPAVVVQGNEGGGLALGDGRWGPVGRSSQVPWMLAGTLDNPK